MYLFDKVIDIRNLREKGYISVSQFKRAQSVMAEVMAAGGTGKAGKQKVGSDDITFHPIQHRVPAQGMRPPTFRVWLPSLVKLLWMSP